MPELPDIEAYISALRRTIEGHTVRNVRLKSVFLVRSIDPSFDSLEGSTVVDFRRIGKRIVFELDPERGLARFWMILHLMISGRLRWGKPGAGLPGRMGLCALDFDHGSLVITEASRKKRTSIYLTREKSELDAHNPGGLEIADLDLTEFAEVLRGRNHTLKRALTDPRILSGIGGSYADEIMHRARISPLKWTSRLDDEEMTRLLDSCKTVLDEWTRRIADDAGDGWPDITAFQHGMAVHGRFGKPCPVCDSPVQRIVYASTETNYCATCQTDGKLLADRSLSRLLKKDWPRTPEELEEMRRPAVGLGGRGPRSSRASAKPKVKLKVKPGPR